MNLITATKLAPTMGKLLEAAGFTAEKLEALAAVDAEGHSGLKNHLAALQNQAVAAATAELNEQLTAANTALEAASAENERLTAQLAAAIDPAQLTAEHAAVAPLLTAALEQQEPSLLNTLHGHLASAGVALEAAADLKDAAKLKAALDTKASATAAELLAANSAAPLETTAASGDPSAPPKKTGPQLTGLARAIAAHKADYAGRN